MPAWPQRPKITPHRAWASVCTYTHVQAALVSPAAGRRQHFLSLSLEMVKMCPVLGSNWQRPLVEKHRPCIPTGFHSGLCPRMWDILGQVTLSPFTFRTHCEG